MFIKLISELLDDKPVLSADECTRLELVVMIIAGFTLALLAL